MVFNPFGALVPHGARAPRRVVQRGVNDSRYSTQWSSGRRRLPRVHDGPGRRNARHHPRLPLITPLRSEGGHRRYSRYQLRIAARARELVDQGTPIEAACRIVILEDQLEEAQRINAEYRRAAKEEPDSSS